MNHCSLPQKCAFAGLGLSLLAFEAPALAADMPLKAPVANTIYDWT